MTLTHCTKNSLDPSIGRIWRIVGLAETFQETLANSTHPVVFVNPNLVALSNTLPKNAFVSNNTTDVSFLVALNAWILRARSELKVAICVLWLAVALLLVNAGARSVGGTLRNKNDLKPVRYTRSYWSLVIKA